MFGNVGKPGDIYYNVSGVSNLVKEDEIHLYLDILNENNL